jgi:glyoxylase-like metal-dependent hydrolase (beta-lactamase superfamily II)
MISLGDYLQEFQHFYWIEEEGISSNIYVLAEGKVLIDSGNMPGIPRQIDEKFPLNGIEAIFITHHHYDHMGSLVELLAYCNPKILLHRDTLPFMMINHVPFLKVMEENNRADRIVLLRGSERFQWDGLDLEVVAAPGHTSGDICLFEHRTQSLFSGDMVFPAYQNTNFLADADPSTGNIYELKASLRRLLRFPVRALFPGHGGPILKDGHEHIKNTYLQVVTDMEKGDKEKGWLELADALLEYHRHAEAIECLDHLLSRNPSLFQCWIRKGMAHLELSAHEEALAAFDKALALHPNHPEAILGKGMALIGLDRAPEAMRIPGFTEQLKKTLGKAASSQK